MKKKKVFALLLAVGTIIGTMACGTEQAEKTPPQRFHRSHFQRSFPTQRS